MKKMIALSMLILSACASPSGLKPAAGVSDAIEEHAVPAQISDPHLAVGVELPAPLDGVGEQLVESQSHRLANFVGQVGLGRWSLSTWR